jgi:hypothetical protein
MAWHDPPVERLTHLPTTRTALLRHAAREGIGWRPVLALVVWAAGVGGLVVLHVV